MYRIFIIAVLAAITTQASALTFKTTSTDEDQSAIMDGAGNTDASVTIEAIGGREIEAGGVSLNYPPLFPSALTDRYFFGLFWTQQDFNQDGHLDFIYTATMRPTNTEIIGKNTAGICGGGRCKGDMPGPSLFLNDGKGTYILSDELMIDKRATPGQSLSRRNLVADYNGDGRLDIFIADHGVGTHKGIRDSYFLSQPDGSWLESSKTHLSDPDYVIFDHGGAVGDIDNDGDVDIVLTDLNRRLICWVNQGSGHLKKRKCGPGLWAAIELADMDGDGDLDLVAGGDDIEAGWEPARILTNNGKGKFKRSTKLPVNRRQPHIPEVAVWDLDADGDNDIILSRTGVLYVGTTIEILENKGNSEFEPIIIPIVEAPSNFVPKHEGNEWNNFIQTILIKDVDNDDDPDVILVGGGAKKNRHRVTASLLLNEGGMSFSHRENGHSDNPITKLPDAKFVANRSDANWVENQALSYEKAPYAGFQPLQQPIYLSSLGGNVTAAKDIVLGDDNIVFTALVETEQGAFKLQLCGHYWSQFNFLGAMVGFKTNVGFGGSQPLRRLGTQSCGGKSGYRGGWELEPSKETLRIKAILDDIGQNINPLLMALPGLAPDEKSRIKDTWF